MTVRNVLLVLLLAGLVASKCHADDLVVRQVTGAIMPVEDHTSIVLEKMLLSVDLLWVSQWQSATFYAVKDSLVIRSRPPGEVTYYTDSETATRLGHIRIEHTGIEFTAAGMPATIFYWDNDAKGRNRFRSVVIAK